MQSTMVCSWNKIAHHWEIKDLNIHLKYQLISPTSNIHRRLIYWLNLSICPMHLSIFTGRNEVGLRQCFYRRLWFCQRGGVSASVHARMPPREQTPPGSRPPLGADPPRSRPPRSIHPREQTPPGADTPPLEADSGIRSMSGRYASYWNAFLFE